jgi:hypothetical protein
MNTIGALSIVLCARLSVSDVTMARYVEVMISSSSVHKPSGYEKVPGVCTWVRKAGVQHFQSGKSWTIASEVDELTQFPRHQPIHTTSKAQASPGPSASALRERALGRFRGRLLCNSLAGERLRQMDATLPSA